MIRTNRTIRTMTALGCAVTLCAAAGCGTGSPSGDPSAAAPTRQTFPFSGRELTVLADYGKVDVRQGGGGSVTVDRRVTAVGKKPADPDWRLEGDTLDLGTVCDDGYVGVCEVTYAVTVPKGTKVDVRD